MSARYNTSLLLIARLIQTPEGIVWREITTITGTVDLETIARDHATENHLPVIIPITHGHHHALRAARRKINQLVFRLNRAEGIK